MNIKKQLNKIMNYVKELEMLSDKQHEELQQYQLAAYNFVKFELPDNMAREEFKALLGDTMFVGGNFSGDDVMEKIIDNVWVPIEHEHPEYAKVVDENARLREALRWHPVSEYPIKDERYYHCDISVDVLFRLNDKTKPIIVWCNRETNYWIYNNKIIQPNEITQDSKWCYIPEDKDGE